MTYIIKKKILIFKTKLIIKNKIDDLTYLQFKRSLFTSELKLFDIVKKFNNFYHVLKKFVSIFILKIKCVYMYIF